MIRVDLHMHTRYSHGRDDPQAMYAAAQAAGLELMGFSEHSPRPCGYDYTREYREQLRESLPRYVSEVAALKEKAAREGGCQVLFGMEMDWLDGAEAFVREACAACPFDYLIGSVHFLGNWGYDDVLDVVADQGELGKPSRILAAFGKTALLAPGQRELMTLTFDLWELASYDAGTLNWQNRTIFENSPRFLETLPSCSVLSMPPYLPSVRTTLRSPVPPCSFVVIGRSSFHLTEPVMLLRISDLRDPFLTEARISTDGCLAFLDASYAFSRRLPKITARSMDEQGRSSGTEALEMKAPPISAIRLALILRRAFRTLFSQ